MRRILNLFLIAIPLVFFAQNTVSITKIIETDCSSPFVKTVELRVIGTVDFNNVQLNYMQNGDPWADKQIDISSFGIVSDRFIYIVRDLALMQAEFPSTSFDATNTLVLDGTTQTFATNGNDGYQLVLNGSVVSQFGETGVNSDTNPTAIWGHNDAVVTRKSDIPDDGTWNETHWDYSGINSLDGETACNGGAGVESYLATLGGSYPLGSVFGTVSITKIIEADCSSPFVKTVELRVTGTVDFNDVELNYMQNGDPWATRQIDISGFGIVSDKFVYIVRNLALMQAEFPSTIFDTSNTLVLNATTQTFATNGNDGYQLVLNGNVVSQFGASNTDGTNTIWDHEDAVVSRIPDIPDNGTWDETHWDYSGKNSLDFQTACQAGAGIETFLANLGGSYPLGSTSGSGAPLILSENTTGAFTFVPVAPIIRPPVKVFYHIPEGDITSMPILMSFHGADRDGDNHRNYWINMANEKGFIVIAPEYSELYYPNLGDNFLLGNIFDDGDNPSLATFNNKNEWTFSTVEPIFDAVKAAISGTQEKYYAWGHSGGAQFLHRFVTYLPNNRLEIAICSNSGWYTVPENAVSFPYGILDGQLPNEDLTSAFTKKLIVHLGQNDNDPNSGLRRNAIVDAQQGIHRLERGQYYFNTSQTTAQNMSVTFNWEKHELAGVGHNPQLMANDALRFLFPTSLSNPTFYEDQPVTLYPNPTNLGYVTIKNKTSGPMQISAFDIMGKEIRLEVLNTNFIDVSKLSTGIYILKFEQQGRSTITEKLVIN